MEYIAGLIKRAGDYFQGDYEIALAGGILSNPLSVSLLETMIPCRAKLVKSQRAPVFGAAAKALSLVK